MNNQRYQSNRDKAVDMARLLKKTIRQFFPDLRKQLADVEDPRFKRIYLLEELLFGAIFMFVIKQESRNEMNSVRRDSNMRHNFRKLFGYRLAHMDTVDDVLCKMPEGELEMLRVSLVRALFEKKLLGAYRVGNKFHLVAVDGSGIGKVDADAEGTLKKEHKNGTTTYTRQALEAKIIVPGGFAISIATEWIATDKKDTGSKEDCEANAFKRLAVKLKEYFPKLPILLLGDGLYPNLPFFEICEANNWSFCVVLKDKKLGTVWDWVDAALIAAEAEGRVDDMILLDDGEIEWVNDVPYRHKKLSFIECRVTDMGGKKHRFVYVSDLKITHDNATQIVAAGRSRWRLEDAFNTQKNRGYGLEHKFSRASFLATKNYYVLAQIAHMICQLVEYSQHLARLVDHSKETLLHLWELIASALTWIDNDATWETAECRTQYRFHFA